MGVEAFKESVESGSLIDYDGFGYPSDGTSHDPDLTFYPSMVPFCIPDGTTHVVWFSK